MLGGMFLEATEPMWTPIALRSELLSRGETDQSLARALRVGALARPRRGAYVDGGVWRSMGEEQRYAVRGRAAYQQARTEVQLSHTSALPLLGAPIWGLDLSDVHLTRSDGRTGRHEAGIQQHCGLLIEGDTVIRHGYRISSPMRATLEATLIGPVGAGLVVANFFLHRGDFTTEQLRERYARSMNTWPGSLSTDLVLRLADPRIASVGESRTYYFLWNYHYPRPDPQYEIHDDAGALIALLDFALPAQRVWIEFDGRVKYQRFLRPGEDVTMAVLREKKREELVAEITGWRCLRVTWSDLAEPAALDRRLRRLIASMAA